MNSSSAISAQPKTHPSGRAVAPAWHTVIVLGAILGLSFAGAVNRNLSPLGGSHSRAAGYLLVMLFEWIMVGFIWWGTNRRGIRMADLVGGSWDRPAAIRRDIAIGIGFLLVCGVGFLNGLGYLLKASPNAAIRSMFPHGATEIVLYLMLSLTAGFCEEVIFRGYLNQQFAALTHSAVGGIVLQGIAFGVGHGYQGWKFMLIIAVYGVTFGLLAHWRRSLRPGMVTHFVQDAIGGLLGPYLH